MPKLDRKLWVQWAGVRIQGDVGPYTVYDGRGRKRVIFAKAPPKEPPSILQRLGQARWRAAAREWRNLPPEHQERWAIAAKVARLPMGGYALWVAMRTTKDNSCLPTLERLSRQDLRGTWGAHT